MRRNDFSTSCPGCGSSETMPWGKRRLCYRCRSCNNVFVINPKKCRACSEWIANGAEYCEWHRKHGFDDGMDEFFVPAGICVECGVNRTYDIFDRCKACIGDELNDLRETFGRSRRDDDEEPEYDEWGMLLND